MNPSVATVSPAADALAVPVGTEHWIDTRVSAVIDLAARLRRVSVTADVLRTPRHAGPDAHLRLCLPGADGKVIRPVTAAIDHRSGTAELDLVLVSDDGPATRWARSVRPGDRVRAVLRPGVWSADPRGQLLVADEVGVPALTAILDRIDLAHPEQLSRTHVIVAAADARMVPGLEQWWAPRVGSWHRIRTAPGREGSMVARLLADGGRIGGGRVRVGSVWAAGACDLVAAVSRLAAERWHLSSSDIAATAYRHRADRSA